MAQLGQYNTLKVAKIVDFGLYLDGGEGVEILMPKRYMPQDVKVGDELNFGGLLGGGPVMPVRSLSPAVFVDRGGYIPAPMPSLKN